MKTRLFVGLAIGFLASVAHAQDAAPAATPPPLPPPPWLKRAPEFSQWTVQYTRGDAQGKPPAKPTAPGAEKKSVQATKTQDIVLETTTRENGAVIERYCLRGQSLVQVNKTGGWIASGNVGDNGFNEADYVKADFAGFGWISAKNYVGVQAVNNRKCLVFQDRVVTLDQQEIASLRASMDQAVNDWQAEQLRDGAETKTPASPTPGKKGGVPASPTPTKPKGSAKPPPAFNIEDYKTTATAYIDIDSGMPVALTYKTLQGGKEGRTYIFQDPPTTPLELPPEVQSLMAMNRAVLRRMTSRGAMP